MRAKTWVWRALGIVVGVIGSGPAIAAEFTFKLHHFLNAKAPSHTMMLVPWARRIEKASNGRVKIAIYPSMTLGGKPPQLPRQVRDGVVDMAWILNGYAAGSFPRTEVFELPGVHRGNSAAVNLAMLEMRDKELKDDFKDLVPMFQHVHGGNALNMAATLVRSPAEIKGLKIRIPTRTGAWVLEALGASPVKTSVGEIPIALSRKVIDGALIPFQVMPALKIELQTKYHIEGPHGERFGTSAFQVAMNKDRWASLPPDIKQIFHDNSGAAWHRTLGERWDSWEADGIAVAKKAGNKHVRLSREEWAKFDAAMQPVISQWVAEMKANGIDGQAIYDRARELVAANTPEPKAQVSGTSKP